MVEGEAVALSVTSHGHEVGTVKVNVSADGCTAMLTFEPDWPGLMQAQAAKIERQANQVSEDE